MRHTGRKCKKFIAASATNIAANDAGNDINYTFNWDNKLRKAFWNESPEDSIEIKYDHVGNRVYKKSTAQGSSVEHKYVVAPQWVVDITGELPVILMEPNGSGGIVKTYAMEWDGPDTLVTTQ